ncbi:unnamed protein product [Rotaria sordida]|uniref:Guanine nucleotide-binding protein G(q) subunit alpha n=1 Tax=Rotaria sordida TaxID=392033 RepID=A0A813NB23_9BILA|nr:unnamed protein product [Rotaria sordida]CAF3515846.1 unnamed protein product [Rotaria sordida]
MKFMYGRGYSIEERRQLIPIINKQIVDIICCICHAMKTLYIPFEKSQNENYACLLSTTNSDDDNYESILTLSPQMIDAIKHIWSDEGIQLCYRRRREYRLTDSAKYFLDNISRISGENYMPNDDDILRVRIPTTGIISKDFQFFPYHLQIVDVGGQKIERQKWIHCFDNVTTIIFFASLIEYDQYIADDPSKQNLMEESLALFHIILSSDYFSNASIILFLNKTDLFPERIASKPLRHVYPEFDGNAEAGKSTFLKQMKLIHGQGFKEDEKRRLIPFIYRQILSVVRCICRAMKMLHIRFENERNEEYARVLSSSTYDDAEDSISTLSPRMVEAIRYIWSDEGVKTCYGRRREYRLPDSAKYFLDDIDRISAQNFTPNEDDILRVRIPTTGIVQEDFEFSHVRLRIVDVGGQKTERRKWIHCFDSVTSVIFLASLLEYDQKVDDQLEQNLMEESLGLFRVILKSDYFCNASIILFLNKTDLFPERLAGKPIRYVYPEFDGADNDVQAAREFIKNKYLSLVPKSERYTEKNIYPHFTCSVDSKNIRIVFESVKDTVLAHNLYYWTPY